MSDLLSIGRSGVVAYRAALSTVGENVSNAETEGYTRRTVSLTESGLSSSTSYQYKSSAVFGGVGISSVQRVFNDYKTAYARFSNSEAARTEAKSQWLETAEGALDDSNVGLGVKMSAVFTAGEGLTTDAGSDTNRRTMMTAMAETVNKFNSSAQALTAAATGVTTAAQTAVSALNGDLKALNQVNIALRRAGSGSAGQALLLDQRDSLLKSISGAVGIDVRLENDGRANVTLTGDTTAKLVDANETNAAFMGVIPANDGRLTLVISGNAAQAIVTPQSGALSGLVDAAGTIASRRQALDAVAADFANVMNTWNGNGVDKNGAPGADLISGTTAATLTMATDDLSKIAAASGGVSNANALALKNTRNSSGPEAKWALLVTTHAQSVATAKSEVSATAAQRDGAFEALDEVTGVDLDVEAAQLLRFQQAYSGSAKIIQVARETLQEIMNLFQ
jgi:flagellar hook-associated protein 1 FlgK